MKNYNLILSALVLVSAILFFWILQESGGQNKPDTNQLQQSALTARSVPESQTNSEGGVEIVVQPIDLGSKEWIFTVSLSTHAGDLGQDMAQIGTLTDGRGNKIPALRWDGSPPGGHHRQGNLIFPVPSAKSGKITVTLTGIAKVPKRNFAWEIK